MKEYKVLRRRYLEHLAEIGEITAKDRLELDRLQSERTNTNLFARDLSEDYTVEEMTSLFD